MNQPFDPSRTDGDAKREVGASPDPEQAAREVSVDRRLPPPTIQLRRPDQPIRDFYARLVALTPQPRATQAIVLANIVVFALMAVTSRSLLQPDTETLIAWGSNVGRLTLGGQWWRLLTSTFVHVGAIHIAFNMWVLWDAGQLVERLVGTVGFLVLYGIAGLSGSLASVSRNPDVLSAGASGAVFGVFGALIGFIVLRGDSIPKALLGRLRRSGLMFVVINLAIGFSIPFIDNAAHLGGLVAGFVCGMIMSQPLERVTNMTRSVRNLSALGLGAVALVFGAWAAPEAPPDLGRIEQNALDVYNSALTRWQGQELSNDQFAAIIESQVLPPWREMTQHLDGLPPAKDARIAAQQRYFRARQAAWEALVTALREPTREHWDEHSRKKDAADAMLKKINTS